MRMNQYNVLWFDDKFDELNLIDDSAAARDILLYGVNNAKDGIENLNNNLFKYDAVIVDGLFYDKPGQSGDASSDSAFFSVALAIEKLKDRRIMPWFILSGQLGFTKETNRYADGFKDNKVYDKTKKDHWEQLWHDLKKEADQQPETQIRHDYRRVFELCENRYIGPAAQKPLFLILKSIREPNNIFNDELYFTQIRIILELMFRAANKIGLLHDDCIDFSGKLNLSESSLFLSGLPTKHLAVSCKKSHFNKIMTETVKSILFITGAASHTVDPEIKSNINYSEYRDSVNTPFLLYSLTFQLIDVLVWFKKYADDNNDIQKNKSLWESVVVSENQGEWIKGEIIKVSDGFGTFKPMVGNTTLSIPPHMMIKYKLYDKQKIEVITKPNASGTKKFIEFIKL